MINKIKELYIHIFKLRYFVCKQRVENLALQECYYLLVNSEVEFQWVSEPKNAVAVNFFMGILFCYHFRKKETFNYEYVLISSGDVAFMEDVFNNQRQEPEAANAN